MNKYLATVRISGQLVKTMVFADSTIHARLLVQYQFGMNNIASGPSLSTQQVEGYTLLDTVVKTLKPIKPIKPLNPPHARVAALKKNVDTARTALQGERDRQRQQRQTEQRRKLANNPSSL